MSLTMYEILTQIEQLTDRLIDPETGEVNEDVLDELDAMNVAYEAKVDNIACLIKSLRGEATAITAEAENLIGRAKRKVKKADSLEEWLSQLLDGKAFSSPRCEISFRPSERVNVIDESMIPKEYVRYKTTEAPDKKAIKAALKEGNSIPGAELIQRKNIQVK